MTAMMVAEWSLHDAEPRIYVRGLRRQRWELVLWAEVDVSGTSAHAPGIERRETALRPRKKIRLLDCAPLAEEHLKEMIAGEAVIDAGFRVFAQRSRRRRGR